MRGLFFFIIFYAFTYELNAQAFYRYKFEQPWSVAFHAGPTQYFGDLYSLWKYDDGVQPDYNAAFSARYTINPHLKVRGDLSYYQISGNDNNADFESGRIPRGLNFRARNIEAALLLEYYYKPIDGYNISRPLINPYVFLGVGVSTNNPKTHYRDSWVDLRPLKTENQAYPGAVVVLPMGVGLKYNLNVYIDLFVEGNYRFTRTDYLDDVSSFNMSGFYEALIADYVSGENPDRLRLSVRQPRYLLENGEPNVELIRSSGGAPRRGSGDPRKNESNARYDGYFTLNFGFEIYFLDGIWDDLLFRKKGRSRFW